MEARLLKIEQDAAADAAAAAAGIKSSSSSNSFTAPEQQSVIDKCYVDESQLEVVGIQPRLSLASNNVQTVSASIVLMFAY